MPKEKFLPISIFTLAVAVIISALIIAQGLKTNGEYVSNALGYMGTKINSSDGYYPGETILNEIYDLSEMAEYLGISQEQVLKLTVDSGDGIPYIKVNGIYIFNKSAVDKWMERVRIELH